MRKMIVALTLVMALSGFVLAVADSRLRPRIEHNRQVALEKSLTSLFTAEGDLTFRELPGDEAIVYEAIAGDDRPVGYAVRMETSGYGGTITLLVGLSSDLLTIEGLQVVEQVETPGLGGRIGEKPFRQQFEGLSTGATIAYVKNGEPDSQLNEVEAISGATITTKAVIGAINTQLGAAIELIEEPNK